VAVGGVVCCGFQVAADGCRVAQVVRCKVGEWQAGGDVSCCLGGSLQWMRGWLSA
jgi:hypothetical protein